VWNFGKPLIVPDLRWISSPSRWAKQKKKEGALKGGPCRWNGEGGTTKGTKNTKGGKSQRSCVGKMIIRRVDGSGRFSRRFREDDHRTPPPKGLAGKKAGEVARGLLSRALMSRNHVFGDISVKLGKVEWPRSTVAGVERAVGAQMRRLARRELRVEISKNGMKEAGTRRQELNTCEAEAAPSLAARSPRPAASLVNLCLHHGKPRGCLKTTGQIQNGRSFFEAGVAEVPIEFCLFLGREFGARALGGNWAAGDSPGARRWRAKPQAMRGGRGVVASDVADQDFRGAAGVAQESARYLKLFPRHCVA
jgi:hypothetical protein